MKIIRGVNNIKESFKKPVVTIGVFDGLHIGHKKILSRLTEKARRTKGTSVVITFDPHPAGVLRPENAPPLLISLEHRIRLIEQQGVDALLLLKFTKKFSRLSAGDFAGRFLIGKIGAKEVLVGENFAFGRNQLGAGAFFRKLKKEFGINVTEVPAARVSGQAISSTLIRRLITSGRLSKASRLLGRPVTVLGTVKKGASRGRILGFPTANIDPHHEAIPPSGVYAVLIKLRKRTYGGVLNIGRRPTFYKDAEPTVEVHIFDFKKSIYNEDLEIEFIKKIRDERPFDSNAELIRQIRLDETKSRTLLKGFTY